MSSGKLKVDLVHRKLSGYIVAGVKVHVDSSSIKDTEFVERRVGKAPANITVCSHKKPRRRDGGDSKCNDI